MSEHAIQNAIRNALAGRCMAFRANVGQAWTGSRVERLPGGCVLIHDARPFATGLPAGFADLFGVAPVEIVNRHVGTTIGAFFAIEVKTPKGRVSDQQRAFLAAVARNGGLAGVARSPADAMAIIMGSNDNA